MSEQRTERPPNLTFENDRWKHSFRIKNFGSTPAHNVKLASVTEVVDWNEGYPTRPSTTEVDELGSIAPNGDFYDNEHDVEPPVTVVELQNGTKAVYLVGCITYDTVFSEQRTTSFCYYVGGDCPYLGGEMYADEAGNDST
jgi:hypothetical protein